MALPLSIFKTPSQISLPLSLASNKGSNETEPKRYSIFRARRKNSRQSRSFLDTQPAKQTIPEQIQAVRVNTQGFMLSEKRPRFEQIMLPQNDPIFSRTPASLSEAMGIKIVGKPFSDVESSKQLLSDINHNVQHLFRCCVINKVDNTAASFNQRDWDREFGQDELPAMMGSVILARYDKEPLHILHAMAMLDFAETVMSPEFDDYQQQRTKWWVEETHFEHQAAVMVRRLDIAGKADRREFEKFWHNFKHQTVHGRPELLAEDDAEASMQQQMELWMLDRDELQPRPEWASVSSPYHVTDRIKQFSFRQG